MILFLDLDGVLHPCNEHGQPDPDHLCVCAPHLWTILRQHPGLRVVFTTTWRQRHSLEELVGFVTEGGGEELAERFIGVTPVLTDDKYPLRRRECEAWLLANNAANARYLILDDTPAMVGFGQSPDVYIVDYKRGLTAEDVAAIAAKIAALRSAG